MVVPFAGDSPINNLHEPGMSDVPIAAEPLDSTNPFATVHLATEGKSNPLYDSNEGTAAFDIVWDQFHACLSSIPPAL